MWNNKDKIREVKKLGLPSQQDGGDIIDTLGDTALEAFIQHGIPYLGKQAVKQGRYYASEFLREPEYQKKLAKKAKQLTHKGLDYAIDNLSKDLFNKASNKLRPKGMRKGSGIDIHKMIGKIPHGKSGFTLPGHKYTGPYNDLDSQVRYDPTTGQILEIYDQPTGKTDAVAMQHDVDYSVCKDDKKCKNKADQKMVKTLDNIPYNERQWGHWLARNMINTKQKLGLGFKQKKPKNVKSRRVKKTGKKN